MKEQHEWPAVIRTAKIQGGESCHFPLIKREKGFIFFLSTTSHNNCESVVVNGSA